MLCGADEVWVEAIWFAHGGKQENARIFTRLV